ncbi:monomethylamine corrinoid protein MtmC [Candidatus Methanoplasma termitum]|uniref:MttC1 protein n=1 Tax=Candidatus Methanoplasma termitum TaxID=1577791 RepID=A0A0A7LG34_9ARCH|nr:cobalamin-dependent protein [Candidatus Methanoplasma termitum]AIZ56466.1 monomethylamine corrinoid protein MtmC [Candidatus Methanoplasma termitum]
MSGKEKIIADLKKAVETWDFKLAESATKAAIEAKIDPKVIVQDGLGKGMETIGERFDKAEIYLPQVVAASKAMEKGLAILAPLMTAGNNVMKGTIIMGTVQGDIHEIGKNVCCAMLRGAGYKVYDLGPDVSPEAFMEAGAEHGAQVLGGSALMTTTMIVQGEMVKAVKEAKAAFKVIIGGAPVTQKWCDEIKADGYSENGAEIVELVNKLMAKMKG